MWLHQATRNKLANTFCKRWEPTRANRLDIWRQNEVQLQKWKIIDYLAVPIKLETRGAVARNCCAQNLTDHWPALTYVLLREKKEKWWHEGNSALQGWRAKTESDETGFGRNCIPRAARAVVFESAGGGNKLTKKTQEHVEAEKNLRGRTGEELKEAKTKLAMQRRKYKTIRIIQEVQKMKKKKCWESYFPLCKRRNNE